MRTALGFAVPKSLVLPHEYLSQFQNPVGYVLDQVDVWFENSGWLAVRSNATDEDLGKRVPGEFASEYLRRWKYKSESEHSFKRNRGTCIEDVINSYNTPRRRMKRMLKGKMEGGMCLLIQPFVENAQVVGSYSDLGDYGELIIAREDNGLSAMASPPKAVYRVDGGKISDDNVDSGLVRRLHGLARALHEKKGEHHELELVISGSGQYIVQTTPLKLGENIDFTAEGKRVIDCYDVLGNRTLIANGLLVVPRIDENFDRLLEFDIMHEGYCMILPSHLLPQSGRSDIYDMGNKRGKILDIAQNASAIIIIGRGIANLAGHFRNFLRYNRLGMQGSIVSGS